MDSGDYSYLDINDKLTNYVVQSTDETFGLQYHNNLNVEPIFAEVDNTDGSSTWTQYELPVLTNNSFTSDNTAAALLAQNANVEVFDQAEILSDQFTVDNTAILTYPVELPGNNIVTSDGLLISNDVLLQLNEHDNDHRKNDDNECFASVQVARSKNLLKSQSDDIVLSSSNNHNLKINLLKPPSINEVIHLVNVGDSPVNITSDTAKPSNCSIKTVRKNIPPNRNKTNKLLINLDDYFQTVLVHKCIKCNYLCEERSDIIKHISEKHLSTFLKKDGSASNINNSLLISNQNKANNTSIGPMDGIKMKSILSCNNTDANKTVYLCSECSLGYNSMVNLKSHMISKHKLIKLNNVEVQVADAFVDEEKVTSTTEANDLQKSKNLKIIKKQNSSKKIKCSIKGCDARFNKDEYRTRHEKCHVDGNKSKFKCSACEKTFTMWRVCSLHLWKCHNIDSGLLTCPMCFSYKTLTPYKLLNHMQIHGSTNSYLCNVCGKSFKQSSQLRNHYIVHNSGDLPHWAGQQKCEICGNYFANSKCLKKHVQSVHNKYKPFICNICGHKTARKAMLDLHLRQHTGEKPHKCTKCEYRTGDHNSFRRHMMRHSGDVKYSCPHCDYQSIQSTAYKNHLSNKHPGLEGLYTCLLCNYNTVNEAAYKCHVKVHESKFIDADLLQKTNGHAVVRVATRVENVGGTSLEPMMILNANAVEEEEEEETQNCFLSSDHNEDTVDTGGITIPAGLEIEQRVD